MFDSVVGHYQRLRESDAFGLLLQPRVLANYRRYQREMQTRPLIMVSSPTGIEIELTNRCNLACVQCLRSRGLKPYALGDIAFADYRAILAQFPYLMSLCLNGFGEPMMHKQFFEIVAYTRKERPSCKIGIYSNGMLINEERAYALMDCGLTELDISIDAADPDTYHRVRRGGTLSVLHDNIKRLVRVKQETRARFPLLGLNFVMLNENEGELVPFVEQAAEFGVDFVNCITYASYDWGFKNTRTPDSYKRELDAAAARMAVLGVRCKSFPSDDISWSDPKKPFDCTFFWGDPSASPTPATSPSGAARRSRRRIRTAISWSTHSASSGTTRSSRATAPTPDGIRRRRRPARRATRSARGSSRCPMRPAPQPSLFARATPSGLSSLNEDQIAERGARLARRDDREYREYLREEQRSQPGCPAREVVLDQRGQATSEHRARGDAEAGTVASAPEPRQQRRHVLRQRRLEHHLAVVGWMAERETTSVQRLSRERDRAQGVRTVDVAHLSDQRVAAQPCLNADLVALAGDEADLDQRRSRQRLEHPVVADRFLPARIARRRLLLNQRLQIPDQMIAPGAGRGRRQTVDDRPGRRVPADAA